MTYQDALKDYVEVKDRIQQFYKQYPNGSLQFEFNGTMEVAGQTIIWGRAYAYRDQEDLRPGIGTAWELVPGKSPFTRGSELMVLETSAWGRAIAALGIAVNKSIATKQEVENAQDRDPWATPSDADSKAVEPDLSALGAKVVDTYQEPVKPAENPVKKGQRAGIASEKQIKFLRVLFGKGYNQAGYQPEPTEQDFIDWFNHFAQSNYQSREEFGLTPVTEILDNQSILVDSIMLWRKDSSLWKDEAF
jgi:hypothetical protein